MVFRDRIEAGRHLARKLVAHRRAAPLVLAIPRGGVPVGSAIADALSGELDVVLVHKLGMPGNRECAVGSLSEDGRIELDPDACAPFGNRPEIQAVIREEAAALKERRARYTPVKPPADPKGRIAIVVDDGLATGFTMMAALRSLRLRKPSRLVVAVPVSPPETLERVKALADEVVCLHAPEFFGAVSRFYENFAPVSDDEVVEHLRSSKRSRPMPA